MPTININRKVFEELVGKKLPDDELKDRISMLGTDLESIDKDEINVEVFPNRPDMLSEQGFARAFSSFISQKTGVRKFNVKKKDYKVKVDKEVGKVRPYTACAVVKNLNLDDEKIREVVQIQEKLHVTYGRKRKKAAIGIYPLEKIEFPITFTARKPDEISFRPLEADKELTGMKILSQTSAGREYGHLLEGLTKFPIFVDAKGQTLSMPPIINSHDTGKINEKTTDVFIECSGHDFRTLRSCLNIIVCALSDMGGDIYSIELEYPDETTTTPDLEPVRMNLDLEYINKRLGLELKEKDAKTLLERMGYGYEKGEVLVPAYRTDVIHQVDLGEDIAIAYGYENFEPELADCSTVGNEEPFEIFKNRIAHILVGLGLIETNTTNVTSWQLQNEMMNAEMPCIKLKNALSSEYDTLRAWVIPSMMEVLSNNKHNEYPQSIFGIGTVFKKKEGTETNVKEDERLAVAMIGEDVDFTKIKQVMDYLFRSMDIAYEVNETEHPSFIPGRTGRTRVNGKDLAYIGEIHPAVLENWKLEYPVGVLELNLSDLWKVKDEKED